MQEIEAGIRKFDELSGGIVVGRFRNAGMKEEKCAVCIMVITA
jgi:hypothetical protein